MTEPFVYQPPERTENYEICHDCLQVKYMGIPISPQGFPSEGYQVDVAVIDGEVDSLSGNIMTYPEFGAFILPEPKSNSDGYTIQFKVRYLNDYGEPLTGDIAYKTLRVVPAKTE